MGAPIERDCSARQPPNLPRPCRVNDTYTVYSALRRHTIVIWLTGLSSSGKTTLGENLLSRLRTIGHSVEMLDGDVMRRHLCKDLGFSKQDRDENIRRIGFVAELLAKNGIIAVVAVISPYRAAREEIRRRIPTFIEVYVNAPLGVCELRDVKGLYRKMRAGEIRGVSGIDDPYEAPERPEVECRTDRETVEQSVEKILAYVQARLAPRSRFSEPGR